MTDNVERKDFQGTVPECNGPALTDETVFGNVFGVPGCEGLLKDLLNAVLGPCLKGRPIEELRLFKRSENGPEPNLRACRPAIIATDQLDRLFSVEIQRRKDDFLVTRMMAQVARLVTYCPPRCPNAAIRQIYQLSFGEHPLPGLEDYPDPIVFLRNEVDQKGFSLAGSLPESIHVHLPKVRESCRNLAVADFDAGLKWCYCIAMERVGVDGDDRAKLDTIASSVPSLQLLRSRYLEVVLCADEALAFQMIQNLNSDAKYAGELETARQEGILAGKTETAKALQRRGLDAVLISECTGLEQSVVEKL